MGTPKKQLSPFWSGATPAVAAPRSGGATAGASLPSHKKDNLTRRENNKARFVAEENIRLYIQKHGEMDVGLLTVTAADCLKAAEFQSRWNPFLRKLKKLFPHGMWGRERQPRSGNWHAHAVVSLRRDFKAGFPFDQVAKGFYANVPQWIRELWKQLRENAAECGLGRVELLPLKHSGKASARYLTKYIGKVMSTEKAEGEEKCRLFGIWGKERFVSSKFSWVSSRIIEKRKEWLAADSGLGDKSEIKRMYGPHWWYHYGHLLMNVIMPIEYYQIEKNGELVWDDLGRTVYAVDLERLNDLASVDDRARQSLYDLYFEHGRRLFKNVNAAHDHAVSRLSRRHEVTGHAEGSGPNSDLFAI